MSYKKCANCYHNNQCQCDEVCEDYTSISELYTDEEVNDMIEKDRVLFRYEWFKYIENINN